MTEFYKIFFAFVFVLALIGVITWLVRRFNAQRIGATAGRGRMPRLAVIDAATVDSRRRLVLVRRDNVEHLVMIGGPTDIVVEANIISRTAPVGRDAAARPPAGDSSWMDEPTELREPAPMPEPPPRPARAPLAGDEPRRAPPSMPAPPPMPERRPEPRGEPMTGFAQDAMARAPAPPPMRPPAKPPMPRPPAAPAAAAPPPVAPPVVAAPAGPASQADQNLAEMAQRLEAALRRPGAEPGPAVAINPVDRIGAPPVAPEAAPARSAPRPPTAPPVEPPKPAAEGERKETGFESLEAEMASLLGRPKNPS